MSDFASSFGMHIARRMIYLLDLQQSGVPMTNKAPEELDFMFDEEISAFNGGRQNSFTEWYCLPVFLVVILLSIVQNLCLARSSYRSHLIL